MQGPIYGGFMLKEMNMQSVLVFKLLTESKNQDVIIFYSSFLAVIVQILAEIPLLP